jgi:hypothetical protein
VEHPETESRVALDGLASIMMQKGNLMMRIGPTLKRLWLTFFNSMFTCFA